MHDDDAVTSKQPADKKFEIDNRKLCFDTTPRDRKRFELKTPQFCAIFSDHFWPKYWVLFGPKVGMHQDSVSASMLRRIRRHGRGWVFTSDDFSDLGGQVAVTHTLKRLSKREEIRRLDRGLYDYPRVHPELGNLAPRPDDVARAVVGRAARLQPSGAYALNLLGLSPQVPMKIVYLTDDFTRTVQIGRQEIILKQTTPKNMATAGRISGLVIQALRHFGREQVNEETIAHLRGLLSTEDRKSLLKDLQYAPAWIAAVIRRIAE